jgi:uncharacterized protein involved in exopolysaccharide biosynthesis
MTEQLMGPHRVEAQNISLRDLVTVLAKHKGKILTGFLGIVVAVMAVSFAMAPIYEAQASLMVKMGREHMYRSEVGVNAPPVLFDQERIVESEIQILTSRDLVRRVLETIGLEEVYHDLAENPPRGITPLEAGIREMQDNLTIAKAKDSNVIKIAFQHEDPQIAQKALALLVAFFTEKHLEVFSNPKATFLEKQVATYQRKLNESKTNLQSYKQQHGLSSLEEERRLALEQRRDLDTAFKETQNKVHGLTSKLVSLKAQISHIPERTSIESVSSSARERAIDETKANLLTLRLKEQGLLTKFQEKSLLVQNIRNEIAMVERFIHEQERLLTDTVKTGKNPVYQELELEILRVESELTYLKTQMEKATQQLQGLDGKLARLDELEKELTTLQLRMTSDQQNYTMFLAKVEEARVSEEMDQLKMANISVVQPPAVPEKPVKPRMALNFFLSVLVGGVSGLLWAIVSEYKEAGYSRPEYASQDLGLPILATINFKR